MQVLKRLSFFVFTSILFFLIITPSELHSDEKQLHTREMNMMTWQEFQNLVPEKIETVLLPVGSIEPHGVIPSGTDSLAPKAMSLEIASELNALIAPTLNYGVTPSMKAYPGAVTISSSAYVLFLKDILKSLADQKFINIIILNGHGGNTECLQQASSEISNEKKVRVLVVNWWSLAADETQEIFGENGGHAGNNETAYIQAVFPEYIRPEQYHQDMATVNAKNNSWFAVPVPSAILLYEKGQGYPTFDMSQAKEYFDKVNQKVTALIKDVIRKWDMAQLYRK